MVTAENMEYVSLLHRIRAELGRPGKGLTFDEIVHLSGADEVSCARALRDLRASGLLRRDAGCYVDAARPMPDLPA